MASLSDAKGANETHSEEQQDGNILRFGVRLRELSHVGCSL